MFRRRTFLLAIAILLLGMPGSTARAAGESSQESVDALQAALDQVAVDVASLEAGLSSLSTGIDGLSTDLAALAAEVDALGTSLTALSALVASIGTTADSILAAVGVLDGKVDALATSVSAAHDKLDTLLAAAASEFDLEVQNACLNRHRTATLFLPAPHGRMAEVRGLLQGHITAIATVESTNGAQSVFDQGVTAEGAGQFKTAFTKYCTAYCMAISKVNEVSRCSTW